MKNYILIYHAELVDNEYIIKVRSHQSTPDLNTIFDVNHSNYVPSKNDKLYFLPGVNVPRIKLKDLSLQYGIRSVRDIDAATHIFTGVGTLHKMFNSTWFHTLPTEFLVSLYKESEGKMDEYYRDQLHQMLEHYTEDVVLLSYHVSTVFRNSDDPFLEEIYDSVSTSKLFYQVVGDYDKYFPKLLETTLYDEGSILQLINGDDCTVIDETIFEQLSDMFRSSDEDNHTLAMEIMANSNYSKSLLYLECLFHDFGSVMANSNSRGHVNFKSLVSYLGKSNTYNLNTEIDTIVESLKRKKQLTVEAIDILLSKYKDVIIDGGSTRYFTIKDISLSKDILEELNHNYVYNCEPDFQPIGESTVTETVCEAPEDVSEITETTEVEEETVMESENITEEFEEVIPETVVETVVQEEVLINNQIEEKDGDDDFEWF
jgi:hypothetical protein